MSQIDSDSDFDEDEEIMIQKLMLKQSIKNKQTQTDHYINILKYIGELLKKETKIYKVVGGRAMTAWFNPDNANLSEKEKEVVLSTDWDIEVHSTDSDAKIFRDKMYDELTSKFGKNFEKRQMTLNDMNIHQIGISDPQKVEYIVDIHVQEEPELWKKRINLDGIFYMNLKSLLESIEKTLSESFMKVAKRQDRRTLIKSSLQNIKLFNPTLYKKICDECEKSPNETITGFNLICEDIKKMCPLSKSEQEKAYKEARKKYLRERGIVNSDDE
jgi:hypothetical protein